MRKSIIIHKDGSVTAYGTAANNPNEYPPPHGLIDDAVAVVIHDSDRELTTTKNDHDTFHARIRDYELRNGKLHPKAGGPTIKAHVVEKLRMKNGVLEDNTIDGWKPRAIFEPELDDDGEEVEGPDGMPEGRWYYMGPWDGKKPNLIETPAPDKGDRRVWKGPQGNEIAPEWDEI